MADHNCKVINTGEEYRITCPVCGWVEKAPTRPIAGTRASHHRKHPQSQ